MRRLAGLPAEQQPGVLVVRAERGPLRFEHRNVDAERGEGERVEREDSLCVLRLAVRLDHPAINHDEGLGDREGSRFEVKPVPARPRQFTAAHA